ncbi:MAG: hypothetical protein RJQ07_12905 [Pseudomonadales bacterium]
MRHVFTALLVLSCLTELMAAATLIGGPDGLAAAGRGGQWSMHYGFAALAIASLSIWAWPQRQVLAAVTLALGVLATFHIGLAISLAAAGDQQAGLVIHSVLAVLAVLLLTQRGKIVSAT